MSFIITLIYFDNEKINVEVPQEKLGEFYASLAAKSPYWIVDGESGFYTDLEKSVRCVLLNKKNENETVEEPVEEIEKKADEQNEN